MAVEMLRIAVGLIALMVLFYWTIRRFSGDGDDPTLRFSKSTETGSSSALVSGSYAVLLVAGVVAVAFFPELTVGGNWTLAAVLAAVVGLHWYFEKEERS